MFRSVPRVKHVSSLLWGYYFVFAILLGYLTAKMSVNNLSQAVYFLSESDSDESDFDVLKPLFCTEK